MQVVDTAERQRYEAVRDGEAVGFAAYRRTDELVVFTHTEVTPLLEGKGVGGTLVRRGAPDHVRGLGMRVLPICPFVKAWMLCHPESTDLDYRQPSSKVTD